MVTTMVTSDTIFPGEVTRDLPSQADGACVLFLGVVRNHNEGREVTGLEYEVYQGMAEKTLAAIAMEASHRWGTDRIKVIHRVGELQIGEVSTAVAVATAHRGDAFEASRYILEELKQRLPIWKREHYVDGDSDWLGGATEGGVVGNDGER
jgi:molybdopterin synthase catalytic subunit